MYSLEVRILARVLRIPEPVLKILARTVLRIPRHSRILRTLERLARKPRVKALERLGRLARNEY